MLRRLRVMMKGVTRYLPYHFKHRVNIFLIHRLHRALQRLKRSVYTILPPSHPIHIRYIQPLIWRDQINRQKPILIYQMGKVGSSSVEKSLIQQNHLVFHVHSLDTNWIDPDLTANIDRRTKLKSKWIRRHITAQGKEIKVITLIRDPVAISVSTFFEMLDKLTQTPNAHQAFSIEELLKKFEMFRARQFKYMFDWFDNEFKAHLGIDIFSHPFDKHAGHTHIKSGPHELLILKLETSDQIKEQAIANFLNDEAFTLTRANVGANKPYAAIYNDFKRTIKLPSRILDMAYNSRLATHFYTPEEIRQFRAKWNRPD